MTTYYKLNPLTETRPRWCDRLNRWFNNSPFGIFFQMKMRKAKLTTEIIGGIVAFLMDAWVVGVHTRSISRTGTVCIDSTDASELEVCIANTKRELITGVCLVGFLTSFIMGVWANLPVHMAAAGSMTPYFAFTVVGFHGTGTVPYKTAIGAVFMEGILFFILSLTGLRSYLARSIPKPVRIGISAGIGLLMTFMALQGPHGLGIVTSNQSTLVTLGGCDQQYRMKNDGGENYLCKGGTMTDKRLWLAMPFLVGSCIAKHMGVISAVPIAMLVLSIIMWIPYTSVSEFPDTAAGIAKWEYFSQIVDLKPLDKLWLPISFNDLGSTAVWVTLLTLFYVDLLDSTGTLYSIALSSHVPVDSAGSFYGERAAFCTDALGAIMASMIGSSPLTASISSTVAVSLGSRTGITPIVVSFGYLLVMIFAPILGNIPQYAYSLGFALGGVHNMSLIRDISWDYLPDAIPAFLATFLTPLTYSVATPLVAATSIYIFLNGFVWISNKISKRKIPAEEKSDDSDDTQYTITCSDESLSLGQHIDEDKNSKQKSQYRYLFGLKHRVH